jgi:transcriptional regulator with XRE-family HTH domain
MDLFSNEEIQFRLGDAVKRLRLLKNLTRATLASQARVSINALRHLEDGKGATVKSLISITRALGKTDWLLGLSPVISINPLDMVRGKKRRRASRNQPKEAQLAMELKQAGTIYFIQEEEQGNIKIGYSATPNARMKQLQTGNSWTLKLLKTFPGTQREEKMLHERFKSCRILGEWYGASRSLLDFIESL